MVATEAESLDLLVNPFAKFSICWLRRKPKFSNYPSSQKTKALQQRVEPEAKLQFYLSSFKPKVLICSSRTNFWRSKDGALDLLRPNVES